MFEKTEDAIERVRKALEVPESMMGGELFIIKIEDVRALLRDHGLQKQALANCHKEIFKLRDALASQPVGGEQ